MKKNIKILLADDSIFMRKILKDILVSDGYKNFIECANGKEALEKNKTEKPDLILLDIVMPLLSGTEVLKKIGNKAKIIIISAVGQDKVVKEAKSKGARGYIVKPFNEEEVLKEVNRVLAE